MSTAALHFDQIVSHLAHPLSQPLDFVLEVGLDVQHAPARRVRAPGPSAGGRCAIPRWSGRNLRRRRRPAPAGRSTAPPSGGPGCEVLPAAGGIRSLLASSRCSPPRLFEFLSRAADLLLQVRDLAPHGLECLLHRVPTCRRVWAWPSSPFAGFRYRRGLGRSRISPSRTCGRALFLHLTEGLLGRVETLLQFPLAVLQVANVRLHDLPPQAGLLPFLLLVGRDLALEFLQFLPGWPRSACGCCRSVSRSCSGFLAVAILHAVQRILGLLGLTLEFLQSLRQVAGPLAGLGELLRWLLASRLLRRSRSRTSSRRLGRSGWPGLC